MAIQADQRRLQAARCVQRPRSAVFGAPFPDAQSATEFLSHPAAQLPAPEGDRELLLADYFPPRLHGRHRHSGLPTGLHPSRPCQQGRIRLFFSKHPARTRSPARRRYWPVSEDVRHWHAHAALGRSASCFHGPDDGHIPPSPGRARNLTIARPCRRPVGEQIAALKAGGGRQGRGPDQGAKPDPFIMGIVGRPGPRNFDANYGRRSSSASPREEKTFDDIIRIHIEDEIGW